VSTCAGSASPPPTPSRPTRRQAGARRGPMAADRRPSTPRSTSTATRRRPASGARSS
jgi:hypothetical protein